MQGGEASVRGTQVNVSTHNRRTIARLWMRLPDPAPFPSPLHLGKGGGGGVLSQQKGTDFFVCLFVGLV